MLGRVRRFLRRELPLLALLLLLLSLSALAAPVLRAGCHPKHVAASAIPSYAWDTLDYVRAHHAAPPGVQGGRYFGNYGGHGEARLPIEAGGRHISYQEWDVHPKLDRRSRGAERIVTGSDGRAWYSADHYCSFTEMK